MGDYVWLSTNNLRLPAGLTKKLAPKFVGPFCVVAAINDVAFKLQLTKEFSRLHPVFHAS